MLMLFTYTPIMRVVYCVHIYNYNDAHVVAHTNLVYTTLVIHICRWIKPKGFNWRTHNTHWKSPPGALYNKSFFFFAAFTICLYGVYSLPRECITLIHKKMRNTVCICVCIHKIYAMIARILWMHTQSVNKKGTWLATICTHV